MTFQSYPFPGPVAVRSRLRQELDFGVQAQRDLPLVNTAKPPVMPAAFKVSGRFAAQRVAGG